MCSTFRPKESKKIPQMGMDAAERAHALPLQADACEHQYLLVRLSDSFTLGGVPKTGYSESEVFAHKPSTHLGAASNASDHRLLMSLRMIVGETRRGRSVWKS